jgi:hypothetical protein
MFVSTLFRLVRTTLGSSKWQTSGKGPIPEKSPNPNKQNPPSSNPEKSKPHQKNSSRIKKSPKLELPEELKKAGVSSKGFDAEMLNLYKKMKAQGADQYAKDQIDKMMSFEKFTSPSDFPFEKQKKTRTQIDPRSLFPGRQKLDPLYKEETFSKAAQSKAESILKQHVIKK